MPTDTLFPATQGSVEVSEIAAVARTVISGSENLLFIFKDSIQVIKKRVSGSLNDQCPTEDLSRQTSKIRRMLSVNIDTFRTMCVAGVKFLFYVIPKTQT